MTAYRVPPPNIAPLKERNGAPRHLDDKTTAIVRAVTEQLLGPLQEQHRAEIRAVREIAERMEQGYTQLAKTLEAFAIGDEDVAIAGVTDGESKELPNLPRYKADATLVYRLTAMDIGARIGLNHMLVAYFLGPTGLNWVASKPKMWNQELFRMTKRRLWHPDVVQLLVDVILRPEHPDRNTLTATCLKRIDSVVSIVQGSYKN